MAHPGRFAFDDAIRASVDTSLTPPPIRRVRAPLNPGGPRYRKPSRDAPRSVALSSTGEECEPTSDTFVANELGAFPRAARCQGRLFPLLRQENGSVRPEAPSIDECPLRSRLLAKPRTSTRTRHRFSDFAALNPASDALSPSRSGEEMARPDRHRTLFTSGRTWPRAARRLLQSKRSASTTCGPRNPVTPIGRSTFAELLILRDRSSFRLGHRRFYTSMIQSKGSRGFTGQGPFEWVHRNR